MVSTNHHARLLARTFTFVWNDHLSALRAKNPEYMDQIIQVILEGGPMYKSDLEVRLCRMVPTMTRNEIRQMLDLKFGYTCRQLLRRVNRPEQHLRKYDIQRMPFF
jgi:hypothetical protein